MKTTTDPMFSNGSEFSSWQSNNCDRCKKASIYNEKEDSYPNYKCSIQRDIDAQVCGLHEVSIRSFEVTQSPECIHIQNERKITKKKRKIKNQLQLEL